MKVLVLQLTGKCSFPFDIDESAETLEFRDFEVAELKIDDALKNLDPTDLLKVDEALLGLADIDPAVVTAVSIAAARAGCRHRGIPLYKFLSEIASTEPQLPVPVPSIACRTVGAHREMQTQHVQLYPVKACSLDTALTTLMQATSAIHKELVAAKLPLTVSSTCCVQLASASADEMLMVRASARTCGCAVQQSLMTVIDCVVLVYLYVMGQVIRDAIAGSGLPVKLAIDYKGGTLVSIAAEGGAISYAFNGQKHEGGEGAPAAVLQTGGEVVESVVAQFKENECVSVEDPLHVRDTASLRLLKNVSRSLGDLGVQSCGCTHCSWTRVESVFVLLTCASCLTVATSASRRPSRSSEKRAPRTSSTTLRAWAATRPVCCRWWPTAPAGVRRKSRSLPTKMYLTL